MKTLSNTSNRLGQRALALLGFLALLLGFAGGARAQAPDLTVGTTRFTVMTNTQYYIENLPTTYNLGPTGLRGWVYSFGNGYWDQATSIAPWQMLVTSVGTNTPAVGIIQTNDVILGAAAGLPPVPFFTNDSRVTLGNAITAAEAGNGKLSFKINRYGGGTNDVTIQLGISNMTYSATAPYNCPKSALLLSKALNVLNNMPSSGSVNLALLASGDTNYLPKVQTYARSIAPTNLVLGWPGDATTMGCWGMGYNGMFLSEYYMITGDAQVTNGLRVYVNKLAQSDTMYGTYNHSGAMTMPYHVTAGVHGYAANYGPVNACGLLCNLGVVLGKKTGIPGIVNDPEVQPAINRATGFYNYFVNKGSISYGEQAPGAGHAWTVGKNGQAALLFGVLSNYPAQSQYFNRYSLADGQSREWGHNGSGWCLCWQPLGVNMGGTNAAATYFANVRWQFELQRRCDGSFAYDCLGDTPSTTTDYWGYEDYQGFLHPTAWNALFLSVPKRALYITGKNANPANYLTSAMVTNAVWAGQYALNVVSYGTNQLVANLGEYDPAVRDLAAQQLGAMCATNAGLSNALTGTLIGMTTSTNASIREAACDALGVMVNTSALNALAAAANDSDVWVRFKASQALDNLGTAALPQLANLLASFTNNAVADPLVSINWNDPCGWGNGFLAELLFKKLGGSTINQITNLLYPAVRAGLRQPHRPSQANIASFVSGRLRWSDVQALAPELITAGTRIAPADGMFGGGEAAPLVCLARYGVEDGVAALAVMAESGWVLPGVLDWKTGDLDTPSQTSGTNATPLIPLYTKMESYSGGYYSNHLVSCIAKIQGNTNPPAMNYFKRFTSVSANPPAVGLPTVSTPASAVLSAGWSSLAGGVPRYTWTVAQGPGSVTFTSNSVAGNSNCTATFSTAGTYVLQAALVNGSIMNSNLFFNTNLPNPRSSFLPSYSTWTNNYGAIYTNLTVNVFVWPTQGSLTNTVATSLTPATATLNATLYGTLSNSYSVVAYWGTSNGGTNPASWSNSGNAGAWTNAYGANVSLGISGLSQGTTYYYTFRATNASGGFWATNVQSFTAPPPPTKLVFTAVPAYPASGQPFSVTVQAQDGGGNPQNVTANTTVQLSKATGSGSLSGTTNGTIASGSSSVVISGVVYSAADTMTLTASATSGMSLTAGTSPPLLFFGVTGSLGYSTSATSSNVFVAFTSGSGTWVPPAGVTNVEVLVVGGGGGGGGGRGGGGGAGGVIYSNSIPVSGSVSVTVGTGGQGAGFLAGGTAGTDGSNSVFSTLTAIGGGRGGGLANNWAINYAGDVGGSGGGASYYGGNRGPGAGTSGQGNAGGTASAFSGTGGGGAGAVGGTDGANGLGGAGGIGVWYSQFAASGGWPAGWFGGGGGGGGNDSDYRNAALGGSGGYGGGGKGSDCGSGGAAAAGVPNTGGGGGGGGMQIFQDGAAGGSGVVIVRCAIPPATKLVFASVPVSPVAGQPFSVTVQAQDANGNAANVTSATTVQLSKNSGGGTLSGTTNGTIANGTSSVTISGVVYSAADTMTLRAATSSGMSLTAATNGNITFTSGVVAAPTFSPAAGTYTNAQSVTISTTTTGASIRYTTDGSTPTSTSGTVYSSPVNISVTTTLKAIAYKSGMTDSSVTSGTYTISGGTVAAPTFSPAAGTYTNAQSVTISTTTTGASIRYTTDGSTPTSTSGTVYSSPVNISVTTTLKAIAYKSGMTDSSVTSGTYTISSGGLGYSVVTNGANAIVTFTNGSGTWTPPTGISNVQALVVGGGGGGGGNSGGGGGGGGVIYSNNFAVSGAVAVAVGGGGIGGISGGAAPGMGTNSIFSSLTAQGGGSGASYGSPNDPATSGGSGGGGSWISSAGGGFTAGQGNSGGSMSGGSNGYGGAGGGGAGAVGGSVNNSANGGAGGAGVQNTISGSSQYYGGGGGGGGDKNHTGVGGAGGLGGGGAGGGTGPAPIAGAANTGGGGGGGCNPGGGVNGAAGGSGVVIVSYAIPTGNLAYSTTTNGANTIITFTNGSGTWTPAAGVTNVQVLVVGGGGGGGAARGGGGGAGGVIYSNSFPISGSVSVSVGNGGQGAVFASGGAASTSGSNSIFSTLTAIGGGRGGGVANNWGTNYVGAAGGSGGGACYYGGNRSPGAGTTGQGYAGGTESGYGGTGGGGAWAAGGSDNAGTGKGGAGGNGITNSITGSAVAYGGGGGGSADDNGGSGVLGGPGGAGGGGKGSDGSAGTAATAGSPNTGGGGGAGNLNTYQNGAVGGAGVVIVSYPTSMQGHSVVMPPPANITINAVTMNGGLPSFTFSAQAGQWYRLAYKNALTDAEWSYGPWTTNTSGSAQSMTLTDPEAAAQPQRFYRLEGAGL